MCKIKIAENQMIRLRKVKWHDELLLRWKNKLQVALIRKEEGSIIFFQLQKKKVLSDVTVEHLDRTLAKSWRCPCMDGLIHGGLISSIAFKSVSKIVWRKDITNNVTFDYTFIVLEK